MNRKGYIALLVVLIIMVSTNPSKRDFENFPDVQTQCNECTGSNAEKVIGRTNYFFIFSIYELKCTCPAESKNIKTKYLGICKNFFRMDIGK